MSMIVTAISLAVAVASAVYARRLYKRWLQTDRALILAQEELRASDHAAMSVLARDIRGLSVTEKTALWQNIRQTCPPGTVILRLTPKPDQSVAEAMKEYAQVAEVMEANHPLGRLA